MQCRQVPLYDASSFLTEIERPDTVDRFSLIYTPIALALAIILSLVASFNCGEPVRFFWAFSAILSVSAPVGLLCAFGASYKNTASRLLRSGAAIAGARQANLLRGTEKVMLLENDLFPTGSIELEPSTIWAVSRTSRFSLCSRADRIRRSGAGPRADRYHEGALRHHLYRA